MCISCYGAFLTLFQLLVFRHVWKQASIIQVWRESMAQKGLVIWERLKIPASQFLTHFSIGYFGIRAYPWCVYQEPLFILQEGELEEKKDVGKS